MAAVSSEGCAGSRSRPGATSNRIIPRASSVGSSTSAARLSYGPLATIPNARPRLSCGRRSGGGSAGRGRRAARARAPAGFGGLVVFPPAPEDNPTGGGRGGGGGGGGRGGGPPGGRIAVSRQTQAEGATWQLRSVV